MKRKPTKNELIGILILITACSVYAGGLYLSSREPEVDLPSHTVRTGQTLELLWERPIVTSDSSGKPCGAMGGSLFVLAFHKQGPLTRLDLIAIDGQNGETKWSNVRGYLGSVALAHSNDLLFLTSGQTVMALSPVDGHLIWTTEFRDAKFISDLFYWEGKLYADAVGARYYVIAPEDGSVIEKYIHEPNPLVDYPFPFGSERFLPIVLGDDAIFHQGPKLYSIRRESISTGKIAWEIENDAISNSALMGQWLFYVSHDDQLKAVNVNTGLVQFRTRIQPPIGFFDPEKSLSENSPQKYGYYVCTDPENKLLYVLLGDSHQVFAFRVNK